MTNKQKIALYVASIFVAGGIAGGSIAWTAGASKSSPPHRRQFPDAKRMSDFMCKRLQDRIGLTDEQVAKIEPLVEQSAREIKAVHENTLREIEAIIRRTHDQIGAVLTPEQKVQLEEYERERREFWRKHLSRKDRKDKDKHRRDDGTRDRDRGDEFRATEAGAE